ncbi:MAG: threonylcarbamoyl-AMP synthase [Actinomycetia bacterium]|nr:threonylcarbamoyl-AMP synthase [Actinomycetes bacterium]
MQRLPMFGDDDDHLRTAADVLCDGGLVAFPTETVYGLGAIAHDAQAVRKIFAAKGRPPDDPLIVHVRPQWNLSTIVAEIPPLASALMDALWPGPLTLVLPKSDDLPDTVTSGLPDVAVRAPSHPVAIRLLDAVGAPLAAPSANRFSYVSATTADHVIDDLGDSVDLVLDGGPADAGIESTVIRVVGGSITVLRRGALTVEQIRNAVPDIDHITEARSDSDATASPGRMLKHYSPTTRTVAARSGTIPNIETADVCFLTYADTNAAQIPSSWAVVTLGSRDDLDQVARNLYSTLRYVDTAGHDLIVIETTGAAGLGEALDDRITRASSGTVASSTRFTDGG